jgi:hypothetical protein
MSNPISTRRGGKSATTFAIAIAMLGFAVPAAVGPAHAGNVGRAHTWPTAGSKATKNPIAPKAIRDHRACERNPRGQCRPHGPYQTN